MSFDTDPENDAGTGVRCEFCQKGAWYRAFAQWSIFDFDERFVCEDHEPLLIRKWEATWIDNRLPNVFVETLPLN